MQVGFDVGGCEAYRTAGRAHAVASQQALAGQLVDRAGLQAQRGGGFGGGQHASMSNGLRTPRPPALAGSTWV